MTKEIENVGHPPDLSGECPHLQLTLASTAGEGYARCLQCGAALRFKGIADTDSFHVVAKEGDDIAFDWPGEG